MLVEINNFTLDLEITDIETQNKYLITHEMFRCINECPVFHDWLDTMNLKIGAK